jgi:hypothetical protein
VGFRREKMSGYWTKVENPPQDLLDDLLERDTTRREVQGDHCPDCGVVAGEEHEEGCDIARCMNPETNKYQQALGCDCGRCGRDVWTGLWPGVQECYDRGLVVMDPHGNKSFDMNALSLLGNGVWRESDGEEA